MSSSNPTQSSAASGADGSTGAKYIYKISPSSPRIALAGTIAPTTLEASYQLPSSALDKKDGFLHMSSAAQVPGTLKRFFPTSAAGQDLIYLLKVSYAKAKGKKDLTLKWESPDGKVSQADEGEGLFAHIYLAEGFDVRGDGLAVLAGAGVQGEGYVPVQSVVEVVSESGDEGWEEALGRVKEWLV